MTLVYGAADPVPEPRTHALIIGIGQYDYLDGGQHERAGNTTGLGQLGSPPISAGAFADWLLTPLPGAPLDAVGLDNPNAPLGSVELLLSPSAPSQ